MKVIDLTFFQLTFWFVFLTFVGYKYSRTIPYFRANFNVPAPEFYPVREENLASLLNIVSLALSLRNAFFTVSLILQYRALQSKMDLICTEKLQTSDRSHRNC